MDAVERAESRVTALHSLLRDFRSARDRIPSLSRPTEAVGAPGTWTGTSADHLHTHTLAPLSTSLPRDLQRIEDAIRDELAHAERSLRRVRDDAAREPV